MKERVAHQFFKPPDLLRKCRLRKMQRRGSAAEVQMLCNRGERTQVAQLYFVIHAKRISIRRNKRLDATIDRG